MAAGAGAEGDTWGGGGLAGGSLALGGLVGLLSAVAWVWWAGGVMLAVA